MKISDDVVSIVEQSRCACLKFVSSEEARTSDFYLKYDLATMCAVASYFLFGQLRKAKIRDVTFVQGDFHKDRKFSDIITHCWLVHQNHILDITITQFVDDVSSYIINPKEKLFKCYKPIIESTQISNLKRSLKKWPQTQNPLNYKINKSLIYG